MSEPKLNIVALGGFGKVTSNMFAYEFEDDIILIDCGMGFPSEDMLGIDIIIPDISYIRQKINNIRAMILTHGHEDHVGALAYILPQLGNIPVYSSNLTAHLVMDKLAQYENMPKTVHVLETGHPLSFGKFTIETVRISHSIPDATNIIIKSPVGTVYHGSDFKFDFTPVDGKPPEVGKIAAAGNDGIHLLLSDSLGSERRGMTPSEKTLDETFEREVRNCDGKFIVTTMSSNISRWRQAAEAAIRYGRRIAISGKSIERNLQVANRLGYLNLPHDVFIETKEIKRLPAKNVCILIAGSQAQPESSLVRATQGEHTDITIEAGDKVVFSADPIPGNENAVQSLIDSLARLGASAVYSSISENIHVTGHGSQQDLLLMMALTRPKFLLPIGGTYRHMVQYQRLAVSMGYKAENVLLPQSNQIIEVYADRIQLGPEIDIKNVMVDGLGVGDVGSVVLRDRQHLAEEGIVVVVAEVNQNNASKVENLDIMSRGFVFDKENTQLLAEANKIVRAALGNKKGRIESERQVRQIIIDALGRFFFDSTRRRPMILPIVVEV